MSIDLQLCNRKVKGTNEFYGYNLNMHCCDEEKIKVLAKELKFCYTKLMSLQDKLPENSVLSTQKLKTLINTRIPHWVDDGRKKHLQVVRSEFGEIITQLTLKKFFNTEIPMTRLLKKERPLLPTRGIDLLGIEFEGEAPIVIIGESKVSEEACNPPKVVRSSSNDCLEKRIPFLLTTSSEIIEELSYYLDHLESEKYYNLYLELAQKLIENPEEVMLVGVPFLVRCTAVYKDEDVGELLNFEYHNRKVRFVVVKIEEDINELSKKVYDMARMG